MPGYVVDQAAQKNFIYADEATLDNVVDKAFVGFRQDSTTGNLNIEIVEDDTPVFLPDDIIIRVDDYRAHFWTKKNLEFSWSTTRPGHLIMEVL